MRFTKGGILGMAMFLILLTFAVVDAGALAWLASLITGHQFAVGLVSFFAVLGGAVVTVWRIPV